MILLQEPYYSIIFISLITILLIYLWYTNRKKQVLVIIKTLVDMAEEKFGSGTGEIKYNFVISKLYPKLPFIIKLLVSADRLSKWIEIAVNELQERLEQEISE